MHRIFTILMFSILLAGYSCHEQESQIGENKPSDDYSEFSSKIADIDLDKIKKRDKLIALTGYNATSYFIYKGEPMGYEYELLKRFADYLDIDLEVRVVHNIDSMFIKLNSGDGDLLAYNLTITKSRKELAEFTRHHYIIHQVLVQKKPDNWRKMKKHQIEKQLVRSPIELIGKGIHIRKNSSYYARLLNLSDEIGADLSLINVSGELNTDDLIRMVSDGKIHFTVADNNIADINQAFYDNIDTKTKISLPQRIAWAVRLKSPQLLTALNEWLDRFHGSEEYNVIFNKYYKNKRAFRSRISSDYSSFAGGSLSKYDPVIKKYAIEINWDWLLLASQIYQESQFNPGAKSWAGAVGIMQVLPTTGKAYGIKKLSDPDQNIKAGTKHLAWLQNYWSQIPDSLNKLKFILGSYNVGHGHVEDARSLTDKHGKDPNLWDDNVAEYILLKSKRKYFSDPVVKYGYCRGEEPVKYVEEILRRYDEYIKFIGKN